MLLANECVAEWLADRDIEACYRVHDDPSPDSLHGAAVALAQLGIIDDRRAAGIALGNPDELQATVDAAAGTANAPLVNTLLCAVCSVRCISLATRATLRSPRRATATLQAPFAVIPIWWCIAYSSCSWHTSSWVEKTLGAYAEADRKRPRVASAHPAANLPRVQRRRACGRRCQPCDAKIKIAQYYEDRLGERYAGTVSWVSSMGLFVRLDLTQVEGLVSIKSLGNEWFEFDEDALTLTGADTGRRFELGQRVIIEVSRVNTTRGHLDFKLIH